MPYDYATAGLTISAWYALRAATNLLDISKDKAIRIDGLYFAWVTSAAASTEGLDWSDAKWDRALRNAWIASGYDEVEDPDEWDEIRSSDAVWEMGWDEFAGFPGWPEERSHQAVVLRCIFGNPFRPPPAIHSTSQYWNDRIIPKLAHAIYIDQAFERMLILADALEESGCDDDQILGHCRGPGPHVKGCWVVDTLLGKH
jgi:hypothetical protein